MFAKKTINAASVGLGLMLSSTVFASSSIDLSVRGTIIPTSCVPTLSSDNIDLGNVSTADLQADATTQLRTRSVSVNVQCNAPAQFALRGIDNRAGSALIPDDTAFGLGLNGTEKIGYYSLRFLDTSLLGDGDPVIGLASTNKTTWAAAPLTGVEGGSGPAVSHGSNYLGFADSGTVAVKNIEQFQGTLELRPIIAPTDSLTVGSEIIIDGAATIEVTYL